MSDHRSAYIRALEVVNEARREIGLDPIPELLPGVIGEICDCPVARSVAFGSPDQLIVEATDEGISVYPVRRGYGGCVHFSTDRRVIERFTDLFDGYGRTLYPELVEG